MQLDGNNINSYFQNTGIYNQNTTVGTTPGFEWPKGSDINAVFTTGLSIGARINGQLAQSMASYKGEFAPGFMLNGTPTTNTNFKLYKISRGDNSGSNPDYANWPLMIPYGAPYIDVNNNHQFDPGIDSIGIRYAAQVIFLCMTDGFDSSHNMGEGFGGGIYNPKLYSQIAWTAWCFDREDLKDIQFIKWVIINKGSSSWNSTYFSLVSDPDLGDANDDYIGCDTSKTLGYCYNKTNMDSEYGSKPPAVGMILHKIPKGLTSFNYFTNNSSSPPPCESDPNGEPLPAYLMMKGFKKDSSNFMNATWSPPIPTKFVYTGDPETLIDWTEYTGSIQNCGGNEGVYINQNPSGDRRFIMSSGSEDYTVQPNDTITIVGSQLIARDSSNTNSVTLLKDYANTAWQIYNGGFLVGIRNISLVVPSSFSLSQNYPNPFNPTTKIRFDVGKSSGLITLKVYDVMGREIKTLVNERMQSGTYETSFDGSNLSSGVYFYKLVVRHGGSSTDGFTETKKMLMIK